MFLGEPPAARPVSLPSGAINAQGRGTLGSWQKQCMCPWARLAQQFVCIAMQLAAACHPQRLNACRGIIAAGECDNARRMSSKPGSTAGNTYLRVNLPLRTYSSVHVPLSAYSSAHLPLNAYSSAHLPLSTHCLQPLRPSFGTRDWYEHPHGGVLRCLLHMMT